MYVEGTVTGSHSLSEAQKLQEEIIHILVKGDLPLLKWYAIHLALLEGIAGRIRGSQFSFNFSHYDGLIHCWTKWYASQDTFQLKINVNPHHDSVMKRTSLAIISPTYDPAECLRPVIVHYKVFI